jgi:hypothetical protein
MSVARSAGKMSGLAPEPSGGQVDATEAGSADRVIHGHNDGHRGGARTGASRCRSPRWTVDGKPVCDEPHFSESWCGHGREGRRPSRSDAIATLGEPPAHSLPRWWVPGASGPEALRRAVPPGQPATACATPFASQPLAPDPGKLRRWHRDIDRSQLARAMQACQCQTIAPIGLQSIATA